MEKLNQFNPESFEELKARYPAAVEQIIEAADLDMYGMMDAIQSALTTKNIFDTEGGMRLIICSVRFNIGLFIHVSASSQSWPMNDHYYRITSVKKAFEMLSDSKIQLEIPSFVDENGVIHLFLEVKPNEDEPEQVSFSC